MAKMMLINPKKRRRNPSPAQLAARAAFARNYGGGAKRKRRAARRSNPVNTLKANPGPRRRRRSLISRIVRRRRSNPIRLGGLGLGTIMSAFKDAAVMGGGAIAMDMGYVYVENMLPANLKRNPGRPDLGDAVKALFTVVVGRALRGPTRGLSMKAATGALTVQAYNLIKQQLPAGMAVNGLDGLGYASPALVYQGSSRIGPYGEMQGLNAYVGSQDSPLLSEYTDSYDSPLLSGAEAEGFLR